MGINTLLEKQNCHKTFPVLVETIISWKNLCAICLSCDLFFSSIPFDCQPPDCYPSFPAKNPPPFVYTQEIRKHWVYLWGNWACINIFHMSLIWNFREMFCVTLFYISHTLWDVLSGGVLSPVSFSSIWKKRRRQHTFRQSDIQYDGWRRNAKRREKQNKRKQNKQ